MTSLEFVSGRQYIQGCDNVLHAEHAYNIIMVKSKFILTIKNACEKWTAYLNVLAPE